METLTKDKREINGYEYPNDLDKLRNAFAHFEAEVKERPTAFNFGYAIWQDRIREKPSMSTFYQARQFLTELIGIWMRDLK